MVILMTLSLIASSAAVLVPGWVLVERVMDDRKRPLRLLGESSKT